MLPNFSKGLEEEEKNVIMYGGSLTLKQSFLGQQIVSLSFPQKLHKRDRRGVQDGGSNG